MPAMFGTLLYSDFQHIFIFFYFVRLFISKYKYKFTQCFQCYFCTLENFGLVDFSLKKINNLFSNWTYVINKPPVESKSDSSSFSFSTSFKSISIIRYNMSNSAVISSVLSFLIPVISFWGLPSLFGLDCPDIYGKK